MLPSLLIKNFRIFKHLKIERLGKVNLFAGKNSTGKSCLLEAVHLLVSGGHLSILKTIINSRDEDFAVRGKDDEDSYDSLRYIFSGYKLPEVGDEGIYIGQAAGNNEFIRFCIEACPDDEDQRQCFMLETENEIIPIKSLYYAAGSVRGFWSRYSRGKKIQSISSRREKNFDTSELWDAINMTDLEKEVVDALRMIQSNITDIALVGNRENAKGRYEIVRLEGSNERVPMKSLGDGVTRIFHIILALVNAKGGVLLIDEAENGLHWGVHEKLWQVVFRLAEQLNVQVFATTHSQDCIKGFHRAWSKQENVGGFYRLSKEPEQGVKCISYACETLSDALESGVEMR